MLNHTSTTDNFVTQFFSVLPGDWQLRRDVSNFGTFEGMARFTPSNPSTLRYSEKGILTGHVGQQFHAYKEYVYTCDGTSIFVYFDETPLRLFHSITLLPTSADGPWQGAASHLCGQDVYLTYYTITSPHAFTIQHHVRGPKKSFQIVSEYVKVAM